MKWEGNLRKMETSLKGNKAQYKLVFHDVLEVTDTVNMNDLVGKYVTLEYEGAIHSILSGEKIKKAFGEGLTYKEFMESPQASPSIMRPELSRIHEGIALRDYAWEVKHHLQPHTVYIALTSGYKVGVTRNTNIPSRWVDQGAIAAVRLAEVPYRQLAGSIEVALKEYISDKTAWQKMLKGVVENEQDIHAVRSQMVQSLPAEFMQYIHASDEAISIDYPVLLYPDKVKSQKLEKEHRVEGLLQGIKGQYLIFEEGKVINIRSHSGYRVTLSVNE